MGKKFHVKVNFKNGQSMEFDTNSDVRKEKFKSVIKGLPCIITEEQHVMMTNHIDNMIVTKR